MKAVLLALALVSPALFADALQPLESSLKGKLAARFGSAEVEVDLKITSAAIEVTGERLQKARAKFDAYYGEMGTKAEAVLGAGYPVFQYTLTYTNKGTEPATVHLARRPGNSPELAPLYFAQSGFQVEIPAGASRRIRFVCPSGVEEQQVSVHQGVLTPKTGSFDVAGQWTAVIYVPSKNGVPAFRLEDSK
ncbi:hypothetical protein K2X33_01900 [bacterium]|nr:hypothetical protein [bacterium]